MSVDASSYRPPRDSRPAARDLDVDDHECLRIGVTVATVYIYPWSRQAGTNYAQIDQKEGIEDGHLTPAAIDALLEVAPVVEAVPLIHSPSWPIVDELGGR